MPTETTATPPVPFLTLKEIAHEACDKTLSDVTTYDHSRAEAWNSEIISSTLSSLLNATTPPNSTQPPYKYSITSTIIQHLPSPTTQQTSPETSSSGNVKTPTSTAASGRRGMHAAAGAYWDNTRDGMWSYKYEAAGGKGLDVVVAIIWIWVGSGPDGAVKGENSRTG